MAFCIRSTLLTAMTVTWLLSLSSTTATAEPFIITVPSEGWAIAVEAPSLIETMGHVKGKNFQFQGRSADGFNISVFVEQPKGGDTHDACFNHYWPLAKRNPLIDQDSVQTETGAKGVKVSYYAKAGSDQMPNVNYYFAFKGRWIDVHISKLPRAKDDEQIFNAFEKHLSYQEHVPVTKKR